MICSGFVSAGLEKAIFPRRFGVGGGKMVGTIPNRVDACCACFLRIGRGLHSRPVWAELFLPPAAITLLYSAWMLGL